MLKILEDSILLKWQFFPTWSVNWAKSQLQFQQAILYVLINLLKSLHGKPKDL